MNLPPSVSFPNILIYTQGEVVSKDKHISTVVVYLKGMCACIGQEGLEQPAYNSLNKTYIPWHDSYNIYIL